MTTMRLSQILALEAPPLKKEENTMPHCPNCGGNLKVVFVEPEDQVLVCVNDNCGWEEPE